MSQVQERERSGEHTVDEARQRVLAGLPVTDRRLEAAGIPTAVLEGGQGPPIVLLHGQGEFGATWERVIPELVRTHRVLVPDLPGHGASGLNGKLDRARVLGWLGHLIDQTCSEPPVLMGHLLGGAIALRFAAAHPDRVQRLLLVDTLGLSWYRPAPRFALSMIHFVARPNERTQDRLFRYCMADLDAVREGMDGRMERLEQYALERARTPELGAALRSLMPAFGMPPIPSADLERLDLPITLIWGSHDLQVRPAVAERASQRYGWPLHVLDGARDDPAIEQPSAFLDALRTALAT